MKCVVAIASFGLLIGASPMLAQNSSPVSPSAELIRCGADSLAMYLVRANDRRRIGTVVDECHVSGAGSTKLITRVYSSNARIIGTRLDTIIDAWPSLEPRRYRGLSSDEKVRLEWADQRIRGSVDSIGRGMTSVDVALHGRVYDGATFDLIVRASPLASGYVLSVPAYVPGGGVANLTARVSAEESVSGVAAWRVEADFAGSEVTFWVAKSSRQLLKQVVRAGSGSELELDVITPHRE